MTAKIGKNPDFFIKTKFIKYTKLTFLVFCPSIFTLRVFYGDNAGRICIKSC
jgi:hypothetical protein